MREETTPVEYTGKVLDQRNDLTGPDNPGVLSKIPLPRHVPIEQAKGKHKVKLN